MKIALAHKRLDFRGGTERDFHRTAEGLRDLGHEVHLYCSEVKIPPPEGVQFHRLWTWPGGRTARLLSFALLAPKVISSRRHDVVVSFGRMIAQDIVRSGGGTHRVFLEKIAEGEGRLRRLWHRVSLYHRCVLAIERRQYRPRGSRKILAVSGEVKREIQAAYGVPEEKIAVIYNGVDTERFHPRRRASAREKIRHLWQIPLDAPVILFVGNSFQRKGLDRVLRAWGSPRLRKFYLLIVGEDANRGRYQVWTRDAQRRVIFAARQSDIEDYFGAADLLVLPALQEAFGNVVLEALAAGLPVITSRAVGAAEVLTGDLEEGILNVPDDPAEIEMKLLQMLDPVRWPALSEKARNLAETYSWGNHFRELEGHLLEVAERLRHGEIA